MCSCAHYSKVRICLENSAEEYLNIAEEIADYLESDPEFTEDDWNDPIILENCVYTIGHMIEDCALDEEWELTHPEY